MTHWLGRMTKEADVVAGGNGDEEQVVAGGAKASPEASPGHHTLEEHAEDGKDGQDGKDDAGGDGEVARQVGREPVGDGRLDKGRLAHSRALCGTVKTTTQRRVASTKNNAAAARKRYDRTEKKHFRTKVTRDS
jgi:hypothetical protein